MARTSSNSFYSTRDLNKTIAPLCRCSKQMVCTLSWTDKNPGRRFRRCEVHGFVCWEDTEEKIEWQKASLLEESDQIRRYKKENETLKKTIIEAIDELPSLRVSDTSSPLIHITEVQQLFWHDYIDKERVLRQMFALSWVSFIIVSATIILLLKN
ncbi:unnamed protein product [Eruca vesicaria subsp. sativa]|uniref:Zinc finger GRF-type domain-containing protein n=1 Tax=Eruca vesicaria subsp. sativa TaxID=29727 RepID=A0ABC8KMU3_ERUVS|nr:unnamed protein product [Eruca vesicaria subsp. sativa]